MSKIRNPFGKREKTPSIKDLSGVGIYTFLKDIADKGSDCFQEEITDRGLSFGDLRVNSIFGARLELSAPSEAEDQEVRTALLGVLERKEIIGLSADMRGGPFPEIQVIISDPETSNLDGVSQIGFTDGEGFSHVLFMKIGFRGRYLNFETYSPESLVVAISLAEDLGIKTSPAHFAYESEVPISQIVTSAVRWKDKVTGKHYLEVQYDPEEIKNWVHLSTRASETFKEPGKEIIVLGSSGPPGLKLNNVLVESSISKQPTPHIEKARTIFRKRFSSTCSKETCDREVFWHVMVERGRMEGPGGITGFGSVFGCCDNPDHLQLIQDAQQNQGHVSTFRAPKENW